MTNFTNKFGIISFRIWFIAVLFNTVIGSLILCGFNLRFTDYFIFGGLFGSFFSLPILFILWALLVHLFSKGTPWNRIMGRLILTGSIFSIATFSCFIFLWDHDLGNMVELGLLAVISGIVAIVSQIRPIQHVCEIRDNEYVIDEPASI